MNEEYIIALYKPIDPKNVIKRIGTLENEKIPSNAILNNFFKV